MGVKTHLCLTCIKKDAPEKEIRMSFRSEIAYRRKGVLQAIPDWKGPGITGTQY